ncbi:hypothetical protein [Ferrigenium sp. UT5]|uniref:hypothetical protein n=1 Tax=Ferrigenium sp. UT5 TaxID=3242105 RepID=UPI003553F0E4
MKHSHHIKMRTVLWAMLSIACFSPAPAIADSCESYWTAEYKCMQGCGPCDGDSGGNSSGSGNSGYDYGAAQRAQEAAEANAAAERQRQEEADRIGRERRAEENRQKDAAFIRNRDAAANSLKGSSGAAMNQLKGLSGADNSGLKGSGFDTDNSGLKGLRGSDQIDQKSRSKSVSHIDTSVVDARNVPSGMDKATENAIAKAYPNAPPGVSDLVRKGFQAVMERDWKVAKAWFEDALNRDPGNPGLQRLVALADYSQQHVQRSINGKPFTDEDIPEDADPQTYAMTSTKIHSQRAWSKFLFPDGVHLRQSKPVILATPNGNQVQLPAASDIEFLFGLQGASSAPARKQTPTFIIGKSGKLIQVPENTDQESAIYIKGKDGKLIEVPQPSDTLLMFPGNSPAPTPKPAGEFGKVNN